MTRAIFLFNHDAAHQVPHLAQIAASMVENYPQIETVIAYANAALRTRIETTIGETSGRKIVWSELGLGPVAQGIASMLDKLGPASRLARLRNNGDLFASCDVLISSERTFLQIRKTLAPSSLPLLVKIPHGAGDRAVTFHKDNLQFDLLLVPGKKFSDEFIQSGVDEKRIKVVGYPKFEGADMSARPQFFQNDRPVFLYNPHFDPHLSSWYDVGQELLRWFASPAGQDFNCIFAPHVMLFRKRWHLSLEHRVFRARPDIPQEARLAPNILVDTSGPRLMDMSYTLGADAYIGDVSSQIYEFLSRPRATFFLDPKDAVRDERDKPPLFQQAGPRFKAIAQLVTQLPKYAETAASYSEVQKQMFSYTFDFSEQAPSTRAAQAIAALLEDRT